MKYAKVDVSNIMMFSIKDQYFIGYTTRNKPFMSCTGENGTCNILNNNVVKIKKYFCHVFKYK